MRQPILRPGLPMENPGVPTGTAKVDNPFDPLSGSVTATNRLGETCLATPAISNGMLFFRTESHVVGIGRTGQRP